MRPTTTNQPSRAVQSAGHTMQSLFATVTLDRQSYAVPAAQVIQIVPLPDVRPVSGQPPAVRGVIAFRDRVLPLVDLRARLGLSSALAETRGFCDVMAQREQDHRRWLAALTTSIEQRQPFALTTDPHQCAFGRWYDAYRPDSPWIAAVLKRFDLPHQRIHGLAVQVKQLQDQGRHDDAAALVGGQGATLLAEMVQLFAQLCTTVRENVRETVVVLDVDGRLLAAAVDAVTAIERLTLEEVPHHAAGPEQVLTRLGRGPAGQVIPVIAPAHLLDPGLLEALSRARPH